MTRKVRLFRVVAAAAAAVCAVSAGVLPAAAADSADPHISDECGDADEMVRVGDAVMHSPDEERAAGFDIRAVWFEDLFEGEGEQREHVGVRVHLELCGDVPEPGPLWSAWSVTWQLAGQCGRSVRVFDQADSTAPDPGVVRIATLESECARSGSLLAQMTSNDHWAEQLDDQAFSVAANRITWTLTPDMLSGEHADRVEFVAPGTEWTSTAARARDGRTLTEAWYEPLGLTGPGANDGAGRGRDFTVGEQEEL